MGRRFEIFVCSAYDRQLNALREETRGANFRRTCKVLSASFGGLSARKGVYRTFEHDDGQTETLMSDVFMIDTEAELADMWGVIVDLSNAMNVNLVIVQPGRGVLTETIARAKQASPPA